MLDTSAIIELLQVGGQVRGLIESAERQGDSVAATTVSLFELLSPIYHRRLIQEERVVRGFARQTLLLGLDFDAAQEASKIMGALLRLGKPVNALDALIGGIAVSHKAQQIVTADHDFENVGKVADIAIHLIGV